MNLHLVPDVDPQASYVALFQQLSALRCILPTSRRQPGHTCISPQENVGPSLMCLMLWRPTLLPGRVSCVWWPHGMLQASCVQQCFCK